MAKIDTTSYSWHRGKAPNGVDTYLFEIHLSNGRCFEEVITDDYKTALNRLTQKYDNITQILVGV